MTNKEIAKIFDLYSKLLILHDANSFKVRSYQNAYNTIRQITDSLIDMDKEQMMKIPGIGKSIAGNIEQIKETGSFEEFEKILSKTPPGIVEMMKIKGIGPKKIRMIWKELGVESLGELEYAINENRLTLLKGFGKKTQENILEQIAFLNSMKGYFLVDKAEKIALGLIEILKKEFVNERFEFTGDLRRVMPIISKIEIVSTVESDLILSKLNDLFEFDKNTVKFSGIEVEFMLADSDNFGTILFDSTGPDYYTKLFNKKLANTEEKFFESESVPFISPVFRDTIKSKSELKGFHNSKYIQQKDIKGVIHNHTIWSDGANSVMDMAKHFRSKGYEYMVITDHSKSAYYANGLRLDQIEYYLEDIAKANDAISDFTVFSGIESDILIDGSLDYDDKILERFDLVISSVHSVLRMDKDKATERLLTAIRNPYTRILGHMTGRILLAREGYPLDYDKIFDACATYGVSIELNANPHRLDIDWSLITKAQANGIEISINPDAHSKNEVDYIRFGVLMAQKGLLLKSNCLNAKDTEEFKKWLELSK